MQRLFFLFLLLSTSISAQTYLLKNVDSLLITGNYKAALVPLENSTIKSFEILNKIGNIYQITGNYSKAIKNYELALAQKNILKTKENLGKCYQKNNHSTKAISLFEEVLKENPNNLLLQYHLAKLYKARRNFIRSKKLFSNLIKKDASNPNYYYYLGSIYLHLKEKDSAKIQFLNALNKDSTHFKSLYNLTKIYRKPPNKYLKLHKFKNAARNDSSYFFLEKGIRFYPKSNALNQLAANYTFRDEEYKKTIDFLSSIKPLNSENKETLAICYYYTKEYEIAKDYLYALMGNRKSTSKTYFYLALIYSAEKDYEKAEMYMQNAIKAEKPQLTEFYFQLGLIHQSDKKFQDAINDFKKALVEYPFNAKAQYQLALTCDSFYKEESIAIKHYEYYLKKFSFRDKNTSAFVKQRIKELKTMAFNKK